MNTGHYIAGRRMAGGSGRQAPIFRPMTGERTGFVDLASAAEVDLAVAAARAAQPAWAAVNPQRRARVMLKFLDLVARHGRDLAALLSDENGKTLADAAGDIQRGVEVVEFAAGGAGRHFLQQARHVRAMDQGRQDRDQVDPAVVLLVRRQRGASAVARAGLQHCQLHADAGLARGCRAMVADQPAGEAGEDRRPGRAPRPLRRLPDGRGRGTERTVRENPTADRQAATTIRPSVGPNGANAQPPREECV